MKRSTSKTTKLEISTIQIKINFPNNSQRAAKHQQRAWTICHVKSFQSKQTYLAFPVIHFPWKITINLNNNWLRWIDGIFSMKPSISLKTTQGKAKDLPQQQLPWQPQYKAEFFINALILFSTGIAKKVCFWELLESVHHHCIRNRLTGCGSSKLKEGPPKYSLKTHKKHKQLD